MARISVICCLMIEGPTLSDCYCFTNDVIIGQDCCTIWQVILVTSFLSLIFFIVLYFLDFKVLEFQRRLNVINVAC